MRKYLFLGLSVLGILLPMSQFIPASLAGELTVPAAARSMFGNPLISGVSFDFLITAVAGIAFGVVETARLKIRLAWIPLIGSVLVGFSFGLPFFLYLRELAVERLARVA